MKREHIHRFVQAGAGLRNLVYALGAVLLKTIFISGYTEDAFRKHLGDDKNIHFLPKPFTLKDLAAKVRDVISN